VIDVLIVDDHTLMRAGLRGLISAAEDMQVVGLAADGVCRKQRERRPDALAARCA